VIPWSNAVEQKGSQKPLRFLMSNGQGVLCSLICKRQ